VFELSVSVDVTEPPCGIDRVEGFSEAVMLLGDGVAIKLTVLVNCPRLNTVIVLVVLEPAEELRVEGLALIEKSPTFTIIVAVCVRGPLVPVMETVYVPPFEELNEQVRDEGLFGSTTALLGHDMFRVLG